VNLPEGKTLSAHWREKGKHFDRSMGRDFELATDVSLDLPEKLNMYGWDGEVCGTFESKKRIESSTAGRNGQSAAINLSREGSEYGGWTYDPSNLNSTSVVYSVGIGEDTSWDEAIMDKHNLHVWGFDPTPKALRYVESRSELSTPNFHMIPEGLSTSKRVATFTMPANPDHVSMREGAHGNMGEEVEVNVNTLENWMKENEHKHLDILKIDIEGSEYDVLEDWVSRNFFPMDQLLVEWHFRFFDDGKQRHNRLLDGLKSRGWQVVYTSPSGQEMTLLRKSESSEILPSKENDSTNEATKSDSIEDLLKVSQKMASENGVVMIQMLNEGFIDMTKSWVCNVRTFPGILEKVLFIATDETSYNALKSFNDSLHVIKVMYDAPNKLSYGDHDYFSYMLFRTNLLIMLLEQKVPIFLIESDAVWLDDPTSLVLSTPGDIVTMSDTLPPRKVLQGGFQLLRPTAPTISVWKKLFQQFQTILQEADKQKYLGDKGSEQLILDSLIRREPDLKVSWLPRDSFVPGIYYRDPEFAASITNPKVILNNYIIGIDKKIMRAKQWNHWFLNDDGSCSARKNHDNPKNPSVGQELVGTARF
jgi:FkbM family methyltransferase